MYYVVLSLYHKSKLNASKKTGSNRQYFQAFSLVLLCYVTVILATLIVLSSEDGVDTDRRIICIDPQVLWELFFKAPLISGKSVAQKRTMRYNTYT